MISFLLNHKIEVLIASEIIFFVFVGLALLLRYWFRLKKASIIAFIIVILNELAVFAIGVFDYIEVGTFSQFQMLIIIFIIYAILFGKSDFKKLDRWIQKKVAKLKGEPIPDFGEESKRKLYGKEHAKEERKGFYQHLIIFVIAQICFFLMLHFIPMENTDLIAGISNVWTKVLIIDFIWSFSYTIWPKKEKSHS